MQSRKNRKKITKLVLLIIFIGLVSVQSISAEIKALWVTAWDITTPEKIDEVISFARVHNFNQIMIHARYRGDALYYPNRLFDLYENPEPVSYILGNGHFDPLAYMLNAVYGHDIEVHAWVTVFVVTPRIMDNVSSTHIYYHKPYWITCDFRGNMMKTDSYEGAYLDPGIPEVHDYLLDVFKDIVVNYPVAGLHLDYIRYPDSQFGHAAIALANYRSEHPQQDYDFHEWRAEQVTRFTKRVYAEMKHINPELIVSAAVISDTDRAHNKYSQEWTEWLNDGYLDYAYMMSYSISDRVVEKELEQMSKWRDKIIVGLRAWSEENRPYHPDFIVSKINIARKKKFAGIALFSYTGMNSNNNRTLIKALAKKSSDSQPAKANLIYGYAFNSGGYVKPNARIILNDGEQVTYSDSNGFYAFFDLSPGEYSLRGEFADKTAVTDLIALNFQETAQSVKRDMVFQ
jgi:uncharacterized lipoprotein YddW (UPF0748 family)